MFIHLTLVPYLKASGELKTKPTQHSVKELRSLGIQPDIIICRSERKITKEEIKQVAEKKIKELGGFFVDLKVNTGNIITLFFDRFDGVQIEHCVEISKHIEKVFELILLALDSLS